ncbi:MAG: GNAT family N-acetyltransferase [Thermoplasmata archaeon]|nr:GNAT family N-acetyltransferase [Thermoplasmata archaeon]
MVENSSFIIEMVHDWPKEQIVELYKSGGWWEEHYDPGGLDALIRGSFAFAIAMDASSGLAIGMGRAISDGVSDAWLQDIVVLDDYRNRGIGRAIIKKLLEFCQMKGLGWIGLVAEPGSKEFYEPLGFKTLPGEPMVYKKA